MTTETTRQRNAGLSWFTTNETQAMDTMRDRNRTSRDTTVWVVVDGPGDDEFTIMTLHDAIENDFPTYRWEV